MTKSKNQMTSETQNSNDKAVYDLEERTGRFGGKIIDFARALPRDLINRELVAQIVSSGTSIGVNYMEAGGAQSKKDFMHKIAICREEAKETKHWLRMIVKANPGKKAESGILWNEAQELTLIFSSVLASSLHPFPSSLKLQRKGLFIS